VSISAGACAVARRKWRQPWVSLGAKKCLTHSFVNLLKNDDGPIAVEYAVMLALIIVVFVGAISALGSNASNTFECVGDVVNTTSG
jgi:pilus assembly protein Flp/PilA